MDSIRWYAASAPFHFHIWTWWWWWWWRKWLHLMKIIVWMLISSSCHLYIWTWWHYVIAINDIFPCQYFIVCDFFRNMSTSKWHRRTSVRCSASHLWPPNLQHLNHSHCTETHLVCWAFHRIFLHKLYCTCTALGILSDLSRPVNLSTSVLVKLTALTSPCHSHADHRKP